MYDYLTEHSKAVIDNMQEVDYLFDALYIEELYNKTLPAWTKKVYPNPMKKLRDLSFQLTTWTDDMKRLRSGPLITDLVERAEWLANPVDMTYLEGNLAPRKHQPPRAAVPKLTMYSGHDTTIARYGKTRLNCITPIRPFLNYSICLIL